jgi:hypothetical protein
MTQGSIRNRHLLISQERLEIDAARSAEQPDGEHMPVDIR